MMDETLRVKIVAETTQAASSLKQLNKETKGLDTNTNAANAAVDKLDKTLNSLGFRTIKLKAISDGFKEIKASTERFGAGLKKTKTLTEAWGKSFTNSLHYVDHLGKKAPQALEKIFEAQRALRQARSATKDSDEVLNTSGLKKVREVIEGLATSRNKYIKQTLNDYDFASLKDGLLKASKAAAKGARDDYVKSLKDMSKVISSSLEKNTLTGTISNVFKTIKNGVAGTVKIVKAALATIGKAIAATGAIALILGTIAAIKNAFNVSELGDSIDKTSQKVGMSTAAFQKWSYVLERCGIEVSQLKTAMRALTRNSMGSNAGYFKQLGIDPSKMSQQELFDSTVKALQNISDSTERARMAYKLFGQSSAELAPLLAISSAEVQRLSYQYDLLGATMSGKVVRASADLQDALTDMRAAFQGLKNTLAQAIIPLITKVVVRITVFIAKINMILQALFGVELEYNDVAESTETVTKNTQNTVTAVKKLKTLISGFDELNIFPSQDNGADLGGMLDDLADYGSDVAPVIGNILPPEAIAELENFRDNILPGIIEKFNKLKDIFEKVKSIFNVKNWAQAFNDFLDNTKIGGKSIREIFGKIGDIAGSLWDKLKDIGGSVWDTVSKALGDVWERLKSTVSVIGETIGSIFKPIGDRLSLFWEDAIKPLWEDIFGKVKNIGENVFSIFRDVFNFIKGIGEEIWNFFLSVWDGIVGLFSDNQETFSQIGTLIGNVFGGIGAAVSGLIDIVATAIDWLVEKIRGIWDYLKPFLQPIIDFLKVTVVGLITGVKDFIFSAIDAIIKLVGSFVAVLNGDFEGAADLAKKAFERMGQFIMNTWNGIKNWFATYVKPVFTKAYWDNKLAAVGTALSSLPIVQKCIELWNKIKTWWSANVAPKFTLTYWKDKFNTVASGIGYASIMTKLKEKWIEVKDWFNKNVAAKFTWTYWRDKFNSIKTGLQNVSLVQAAKNMINGLINTIETGLNRLVDKINGSGIIGALKNIGVNIQLNRVYIPRLAKGAVIDQPTTALMGEYAGAKQNPEIVTPENKMREVFESSNDDIVNVLVQGFRQIIQAIDEKDTTVQIGDTTIAKSAARGNNQYRLQTGQSLF